MRNKSIFLLLAGVCGTVAAVGVGQWMQAQPGGPQVKMSEILVTTVAINSEEEITADKLRLEQWPADRVPKGSSGQLKEFEGRFAKVPLFAGEPIVDLKLMNEVEDKVVPLGYTVVSLDSGRDGTVNLVAPGDRVDIRGFFQQGEMFARDMALDVLTGIKVYGIDGITKFTDDNPRPRNARNIQLLIRKADVEAFDFAKKLGEISLTLGSPTIDDASIGEDEPSAAALKFMKDLKDRRAEQERLRALAAEQELLQGPEEPEAEVVKEEAKVIGRMVKLVNGRMIEYEWIEGESVPRVRADTGPTETASTNDDSSDDSDSSTEEEITESDDFLTGIDSPFFQDDEE